MLEITGAHIAQLNDEDLRGLVVRLCEAEVRANALPLSSVTAGGHQNAPDGGIDVRVERPDNAPSVDFVPRRQTGFQVKCTDMPAAEIAREMRPEGELRSSIAALAASEGGYIIVSSQGSVADSVLLDRRNAMRNALHDCPHAESLLVDFYDRDRLARWVRCFPGVEMWLRERTGNSLSGWRGYGNWAYRDSPGSAYFLDDGCHIFSSDPNLGDPMTAAAAIAEMRRILASPRGIVRLVGLSGLGKTRLVQALFDDRIGSDTLDPSMVLYTDLGLNPNPTPLDMLQRLSANRLRAIVVVDNCNPGTHRVLTEIVTQADGRLGLVTVEYDVADDEPEETHVFRLQAMSDATIVNILQRTTPHVSEEDRRRIAEFSGGNARIALALASTISRRDSVGVLTDSELFRRLFHQNQGADDSLMSTAEAFSLVYSFDIGSPEGSGDELSTLASLAGTSTLGAYRHITQLQERDLVQKRGRWRAILPHAIANRLAAQALARIPAHLLISEFQQDGRVRLLRSFTRRLCYLHDSETACRIAQEWFTVPNRLSNPTTMDALDVSLFENLAPLCPRLAIERIQAAIQSGERDEFLSTVSSERRNWISLLRKLAYDSQLFERAALLLAEFRSAEPENYRVDSAKGGFLGLFHILLSGTHATVEQRLGVARQLLEDADVRLQHCGLEALDGMLEAWHFNSSHDPSFGARSRDHGWSPRTSDEQAHWYRSVLVVLRGLLLPESPHRHAASEMLAQRFRALWVTGLVSDELEQLVVSLASLDGWRTGWIAIRQTLNFDSDRMQPLLAEKLRQLDEQLRPRDLEDRVRAYVLVDGTSHIDIGESPSASGTNVHSLDAAFGVVEVIGRELASSPELLTRLLPDLLRNGSGNQWSCGQGLAESTCEPIAFWKQCVEVLATLPDEERSVWLMRGFIERLQTNDPTTAGRLLDAAVNDNILAPCFPILQASFQIDESGAQRLLESLRRQRASAGTYAYLKFGRFADLIEPEVFRDIVLGISKLAQGYRVAVEVFSMRLHTHAHGDKAVGPILLATGCLLLEGLSTGFDDANGNIAYAINELAEVCLAGNEGDKTAYVLCRIIVNAWADGRHEHTYFGDLVSTLFRIHPLVALGVFFDGRENNRYSNLEREFGVRSGSPVNSIDADTLIGWADANASVRYAQLAWEIRLIDANGEFASWSSLAERLLTGAVDREVILTIFGERLIPTSWSGSKAHAMAPQIAIVEQLVDSPDSEIAHWARRQRDVMNREIEEDLQRERASSERFE
jgi:hypothetical protein